jgi:hypothetical protein
MHLPLSHERLDCWAAAMVCFFSSLCSIYWSIIQLSDATVDIRYHIPPNDHLFDDKHTKLSPVLQRCRDAQNQAAQAAATAPAAPTFNFTIGKEVIDLLCGNVQDMNPGAPAPPYQDPVLGVPPVSMPIAMPALPVANPAIPWYDVQYPNLLQADRLPGPDMIIEEFCAQYELGDGTQQMFVTHGYERARVLRFITLGDVIKMELHLGEIAELRDAIERWSVAR